ncbi:unnamed protein product [Mytilus edulis]|uniref:Uncharacterized protein n=1 Tax=Mytilus edulis TaxID=6550 RepID=A0A8S3V8R2_MYTED|nr:unnamed protein product [Mytilus edulis]
MKHQQHHSSSKQLQIQQRNGVQFLRTIQVKVISRLISSEGAGTISEDNTSKGSSQDLSVAEERSTVTEVNPSKKSSQGLSVAEERITVAENNQVKKSAQGLSVTQEKSSSSQKFISYRELHTVTEENTSKGLYLGLIVSGRPSTVSEHNPSKQSSQGSMTTRRLIPATGDVIREVQVLTLQCQMASVTS